MPGPAFTPPASPDWSAAACDVAKGLTAAPPYRHFGEFPKGPDERPKDRYPPSIWPKPLPRVGTTVTTPEGETIIWVSDYCYVSISSRSLTLKDIHDVRKGVRICVLADSARKRRGATCSTRSSACRHRKYRAATGKASAYPAPDELPATRTRTRTVREVLRSR